MRYIGYIKMSEIIHVDFVNKAITGKTEILNEFSTVKVKYYVLTPDEAMFPRYNIHYTDVDWYGEDF